MTRCVILVMKGLTWSATMLRYSVAFKQYPTDTKGLEVCQGNIPFTITPAVWTVNTRQGGSMNSRCSRPFLTLLSKWHHRTQDSIGIVNIFQYFTVQFHEPLQIIASVSCSFQTGVAPSVIIFYFYQSASRSYVFCIPMHLGCKQWYWGTVAFLSSLPSLSILFWPLTSSTWHFCPQTYRSLGISCFLIIRFNLLKFLIYLFILTTVWP